MVETTGTKSAVFLAASTNLRHFEAVADFSSG